MSYVTGVILASLAMGIIIAMVHQTWSFLRGQQAVGGQPLISRRQFILRLSTGTLLLITIGLMFYVSLQHFTNPLVALVYWGILTFLPLVVIILAWLDLRELARTRHQRQAELYRSLADLPPRADKGGPRSQGGPGTL